MECADRVKIRKAAKKDSGDKNLPRKFERWNEKHYVLVRDLLSSLYHALERSSFEHTVAYILFKEYGNGFRVKSIGRMAADDEAESLFSGAKERMAADDVLGISAFFIESASGKLSNTGLDVDALVKESDFPLMVERAKRAKDRQEDIIKTLNG